MPEKVFVVWEATNALLPGLRRIRSIYLEEHESEAREEASESLYRCVELFEVAQPVTRDE